MTDSTSLEREESFAMGGSSRPQRAGALFEQFFIVGLPPTTKISASRSNEKSVHPPQILYQWPPSAQLRENNEQVACFCFPHGVTTTAMSRTASGSNINNVLYGALSAVEKPDRSFVFLLTGSSNALYGVCVCKDDELVAGSAFFGENDTTSTSTSTSTDNSTSNSQSSTSSSEDKGTSAGAPPRAGGKRIPLSGSKESYDIVAPRVYCIVTKFPFMSLHFEVLYTLIERERLYSLMKCHKGNIGGMGDLPTASDVLHFYHNIQQPEDAKPLSFKLPGSTSTIQFYCPVGEEDHLIANWGLFNLLDKLSGDSLATLVTCVLLEQSVLIVSKSLGVVSSAVLSLVPLIKPFVWQGAFIPILPEILSESLDSPIPFIMGMQYAPEDVKTNSRDFIIVDLDAGTILPPTTSPRKGRPVLPEYKKLVDSINKAKQQFQELQGPPLQHRRNKLTEDILNTFHDYVTWMIDLIGTVVMQAYVTGSRAHSSSTSSSGEHTTTYMLPVNVASPLDSIDSIDSAGGSAAAGVAPDVAFLENDDNVHAVIENFHYDQRPFFREFLKSQLFSVYSGKLMRILSERTTSSLRLSERLEALIELEQDSCDALAAYKKVAAQTDKAKANLYGSYLKSSQEVLSVLKESKRQLDTEVPGRSPRIAPSTGFLSSLLPAMPAMSAPHSPKLELGGGRHRRSRSITEQIEETVFQALKQAPPALPAVLDLEGPASSHVGSINSIQQRRASINFGSSASPNFRLGSFLDIANHKHKSASAPPSPTTSPAPSPPGSPRASTNSMPPPLVLSPTPLTPSSSSSNVSNSNNGSSSWASKLTFGMFQKAPPSPIPPHVKPPPPPASTTTPIFTPAPLTSSSSASKTTTSLLDSDVNLDNALTPPLSPSVPSINIISSSPVIPPYRPRGK